MDSGEFATPPIDALLKLLRSPEGPSEYTPVQVRIVSSAGLSPDSNQSRIVLEISNVSSGEAVHLVLSENLHRTWFGRYYFSQQFTVSGPDGT